MSNNYSIIIQWSEKDNCFVATLPEWENYNTHGESYEEALVNAQEALTFLVKSFLLQGKILPKVKNFKISTVAK